MGQNDYIAHFGVSKANGAKVGSGRYPLGSGQDPYQHAAKASAGAHNKKYYEKAIKTVWETELDKANRRPVSSLRQRSESKAVKKINEGKLDINDYLDTSAGDPVIYNYLKKAGVKFQDRTDKEHMAPRKLNMSNDDDNYAKLMSEIDVKSGSKYFGTNFSKARQEFYDTDPGAGDRPEPPKGWRHLPDNSKPVKKWIKEMDQWRDRVADYEDREAGVVLSDLNYEDTKEGRRFLVENGLINYD